MASILAKDISLAIAQNGCFPDANLIDNHLRPIKRVMEWIMEYDKGDTVSFLGSDGAAAREVYKLLGEAPTKSTSKEEE